MKKVLKIFAYLTVLLLSVSFIYYGNQYINKIDLGEGLILDREKELDTLVFAKIMAIDKIVLDKDNLSYKDIQFTAKLIKDKEKNSTIIHASQNVDVTNTNIAEVSVGDKVVLLSYDDKYLFQDYYRLDKVIFVGFVFIGCILLMGGTKGFNTMVSLALTCLSIFCIFIPSIKAGCNIYISSIVICVYIIIMTLIIIYGLSKKSITAILSCITGVFFSGILSLIINSWIKLTGHVNEDTYMLSTLLGINVDLKAIIFSMITIGALGAIMDVSMSITSSLSELKKNDKGIKARTLMKSGLSIGRDIMGTMANTLILAYIGGSLIVVLVYSASNYPLLSILNKEAIIFEFMQSLIGSLSLLFTIPFTAFIASLIFSGKS